MKANKVQLKQKLPVFGRSVNVVFVNKDSSTDTTIQTLTSDNINYASIHYEGGLLTSVMKQLDLMSTVEFEIGTYINATVSISGTDAFLGRYIVYSCEKQEDSNDYKVIAYDSLLYSMKDYEDLGVTYPITIRAYLKALCTKIGLDFDDTKTFPNYDKELTKELYLDSNGKSMGYVYRDVLTEIAQATGSTICIDDSTIGGKTLTLRYVYDTEDTIDEKFFKDTGVSFGEKFGPINSLVLSRSADSDITDPVEDAQSIAENGICQIKIKDNQIMNWQDRETYMQGIFDAIDGIEYYINDCSSTGIIYYDLLDKYNVSIGNNIYQCIMFNDEIIIDQGLEERFYADEMEEYVSEITKSKVNTNKVDRISLTVDQQEGIIQGLIEDTQDLREYLNTVSGTGVITLTNTPNSNGAIGKLEISGFSDMSLYPGVSYPSDTTYPGKLTNYIIVTSDGTNVVENYIDLGEQLSSTDKLIVDNSKIYIQRGTNLIDTGKMISIQTFAGDTLLYVKYFSGVNMICEYVVSNNFTDHFATQGELNSTITQTANNINLEVKKKMDGEDFTGANIMLAINDDTSQISVNADKLNINGVISANGNFAVDTDGNMSCNNAVITGGKIKINTQEGQYTEGLIIGTDDDYTELNNTGLSCFETVNGLRTMSASLDTSGTLMCKFVAAPNIQSGSCTLKSSSDTSVNFDYEFPSRVPCVVITPVTSTSGVIAPKIKEVTRTGFKATIGGSISGNIVCNWIAIDGLI